MNIVSQFATKVYQATVTAAGTINVKQSAVPSKIAKVISTNIVNHSAADLVVRFDLVDDETGANSGTRIIKNNESVSVFLNYRDLTLSSTGAVSADITATGI